MVADHVLAGLVLVENGEVGGMDADAVAHGGDDGFQMGFLFEQDISGGEKRRPVFFVRIHNLPWDVCWGGIKPVCS